MTSAESETRRSINEVNNLIRALVEQETLTYPFWVRGIITRHFQSDKGHVYFDISDDDFSISCFLNERRRGHLDFDLTNGLEIEVFGSVRVYDRQAKVQIDVEQIRLIAHDPFQLDQDVQARLVEAGCWPPQKRSLPQRIERIGLVTNQQSRGLEDFRSTFYSSGGQGAIEVADVRVGGQQAPRQIAAAIERLNREKQVDVIALVRGGGRVEELAIYNDFAIAAAICKSQIPVITGIGHHQDNHLADQMADVAEITPTAAGNRLAQLAQPIAQPDVPATPQATIQRNNTPMLLIAMGIIILVLVGLLILQNLPA